VKILISAPIYRQRISVKLIISHYIKYKMKKETRLKKSIISAVKSTINRFETLNPNDRYALLEELG
tara:strand:+ start:492 stop:689 length:198 start_codon:yes stop_codon:yes gene_type:complete